MYFFFSRVGNFGVRMNYLRYIGQVCFFGCLLVWLKVSVWSVGIFSEFILLNWN